MFFICYFLHFPDGKQLEDIGKAEGGEGETEQSRSHYHPLLISFRGQ